MTYVIKDYSKFYPQIFLEEALLVAQKISSINTFSQFCIF